MPGLAQDRSALPVTAAVDPGGDAKSSDRAIAPREWLATAPGWQGFFPVRLRAVSNTACPIDDKTSQLNQAWLETCLTSSPSSVFSVELLAGAVQRINRSFFDNGYVNSGVRIAAPERLAGRTDLTLAEALASLSVVAGILSGTGREDCGGGAAAETRSSELSNGYVRRRLLISCNRDEAFNLYLLERDFRRLADDRDFWVKQVNLGIEPDGLGKVRLGRSAGAAASDRPVSFRSRGEIEAGVANNRSPSIGSLRAFSRASLLPVPGIALEAELGDTAGALDGRAAISLAVAPNWTLTLDGAASDAQVVNPLLRPLDIRSRGWGANATLEHSVLNCPVTPKYGSPFEGNDRRSGARGFFNCPLAVRVPGDTIKGLSTGRDIGWGFTLSYSQSQSFLLGEPFSFSPGSVDGRSHLTVGRTFVDLLERGRIGETGQRGWTLSARAELSKGIAGSRTDVAGVDSPPRNFMLVRAQVAFAREVKTAQLILIARVAGQWTSSLLYTSERFPVGGVNSVRGYPEAVLLADRAIVGSVELARFVSLDPRRSRTDRIGFDPLRFRVSAFVDGGIATTLGMTPATNRLGSVGATLGWWPAPGLSADFSYGRRLGRSLDDGGKAVVNDGVHFAVTLNLGKLIKLFRGSNSGRKST